MSDWERQQPRELLEAMTERGLVSSSVKTASYWTQDTWVRRSSCRRGEWTTGDSLGSSRSWREVVLDWIPIDDREFYGTLEIFGGSFFGSTSAARIATSDAVIGGDSIK
jgi:hypothetical protein